MGIDTSMYSAAQPIPVNIPSPLANAQAGMAMSDMAMKQAQMGRQFQAQNAARNAYANNTDSSGNLDQQGFLSDLAKTNPMAAETYRNQFADTNKKQAEAQAAQVDGAQKTLSFTVPVMHYIAGTSEENRPAAYKAGLQTLKDAGVNIQNFPQEYDPGWFRQTYAMTDQIGSQMKDFLANQGVAANTAKTQNEADAQPLKNQETQSIINKNNAEADKTRSETIKRQPLNGAQANDPNTDPALLVPGNIPKEHQPKAFDEIKTAQDIKALTPKIMAAFQMGSSRNPITAAQGQREFEGLINTTVKDTEGTARQAAFDSIHRTMTPSGITATPGENDTKLRTVQEYLASKAAAPTAMGYGINLKNYNSTSPYQAPAKTAAVPSPGGATADVSAAAPNAAAADHEGALKWLKTADPSSPQAFKVRAALKAQGLL